MRNQLFVTCTMVISACTASVDVETGPDAGMATETEDPSEEEEVAALAAVPPGCVSVNLKTDVGAKGDGVANDTAAFQRAAQRIQAAGCGELIIPPAMYIVGNQIVKT